MKHLPVLLAVLLMASLSAFAAAAASVGKPNIVIILADDLGYGDVQCNNPDRGKIATPHIDKLASQGMRFTDGHSSSGVCTPSRYSLLTGRYHWRTSLQKGVLGGMSKPLIPPDRLTLAGLVKAHGYDTACVGKWHLGMTMPTPITEGSIKDGPTTHGFDYYFGISASLDMPPYAFIENDRFTESPTAKKSLLWIGGKEESRLGPAAPGFESEQVLPMFVRKSADWIAARKDKPFLLYLALNSPHTPVAPTQEWKGKSGLGDYADFVMQTDAAVGDVLAALATAGVADNTLVILTSDNGCAPYVGTKVSANPRDSNEGMEAVKDLEKKGHFPSGPLRGYKADAWEGGHHVPFIARWPTAVAAGTVCNQLVQQADLMATIADILGDKLPDNAGEDSFSLLPLLKGNDQPVRPNAVSAAMGGVPSVRQGHWKYIAAPGSGGWGKGGDQSQPVQLYNLADDLAETKNLAAAMPEKVAELKALLEKLITEGRSTPGARQKNDVEVKRFPAEAAETPKKKAKAGK
ncbi:sulfatase family protein [Humisphaera borealis]|uniref:Arylsulfatase n=1 Tax=Humisphaera borealis TaxID=2807512 RepID=A0A7M2WPI0_9BACT|nr:arylsulfatase [Humisphaera borealis]QOV87378.1 arylsulfatase [Humisphaera borealis]